MGQEVSLSVDENTPSRRLKKRDLESVAGYIKDGKAKRIVVIVGSLRNRMRAKARPLIASQLTVNRLVQVSAPLQEFPTSGRQNLVSTQI